ncbi:MAG TPA: hypothetical protein VGF59_08905, partial [Bryobacteraceae bacterium]
FRYWGIRTVSNTTDLNFRIRNWFGVYGGYGYSDRLIRTIESFELPDIPGSASRSVYEQENQLHTGRVGFRLKPVKPLTINVTGEIGRADRPLTPIADRNYHAINGRVDYRLRKLQFSATYRQVYNVNEPAFFSVYSSHSRNYSANASWAPYDWFSIDASYMKLHNDSAGSLYFFAGVSRPTIQSFQGPLYISNIHAANLGARFGIRKRADVYFGYSITRDTGDGRPGALVVPGGVTDPIQGLLASVQTFPLSFQSPLARVSIRISPKVRWNAAWQYYGYHEYFTLLAPIPQNYHANTGYTSVLWSF